MIILSVHEKQEAPKKGDERSDTSKFDPKLNSVKEVGGREGPEPTRYGDWEKNGIISDF